MLWIFFSALSKLSSSYRMWLSQGIFLAFLSITAKVEVRRSKVTALLGFLLGLTLWPTCSWFHVIYSNEFGQSACSTFVPIFIQLTANILQIRGFCSACIRQGLLQLFTLCKMIFWGFSGSSINLFPFLSLFFLFPFLKCNYSVSWRTPLCVCVYLIKFHYIRVSENSLILAKFVCKSVFFKSCVFCVRIISILGELFSGIVL